MPKIASATRHTRVQHEFHTIESRQDTANILCVCRTAAQVFFRYFAKPFKIDTLTKALGAAIDVAHARSPACKTKALKP